jgi:beta-aspartyl-peptidase (threonine type)
MKAGIIIHGGTGSYDINDPIEAQHQQDQRAGLTRIIDQAWKELLAGMAAIDLVERIVNQLEDCPVFNAGIGAALGNNMEVELDASIMDGRNLQAGAVAGLESVPHAISVARRVLRETKHVLLTGKGLNDFVLQHGFARLPKDAFITEYQLQKWKKTKHYGERATRLETVGAVVRDLSGNIAAGTSTGGVTRKLAGRVGDSPLIGAGTYADNQLGGVSCTGYGEQIIKVVMAKSALDILSYTGCSAQAACEAVVCRLSKLELGFGGLIMIDPQGNFGAFSNETFLARAYRSSDMPEPVVAFEVGEREA